MGSLGTVVGVATKGAKYPHDLTAPVAAGLEPDKISSEASEYSDTKYETHVQSATTGESPCGQKKEICRDRQTDLAGKHSCPEKQIGDAEGMV